MFQLTFNNISSYYTILYDEIMYGQHKLKKIVMVSEILSIEISKKVFYDFEYALHTLRHSTLHNEAIILIVLRACNSQYILWSGLCWHGGHGLEPECTTCYYYYYY